MAALGAGAFNSKQFIFVVGENKSEFRVHAGIISKQSKALDALINGSMAEALEGKATFDDVQEDTFERFCQFAYTGNYTTPAYKSVQLPSSVGSDEGKQMETILEPVPEPAPDYEPVPEPEPETDGEPVLELRPFGDWGTTRKFQKLKKPPKLRLLRQSLEDLRYKIEIIPTKLTASCEVRQNSCATEDYTKVFLGHAHLYVFAEKWGITDLKSLSLSKLHKTLVSFTLYAARRPDIVELLRYTYSNNHTPDRIDAVDDLRSLVMLYAGCEAENLTNCSEFLSLIGEGGELAQEFVQMLMKKRVS